MCECNHQIEDDGEDHLDPDYFAALEKSEPASGDRCSAERFDRLLFLLHLLHPEEHEDPTSAPEPADLALTQEQRATVYEERHSRGESLYHPDDLWRDDARLEAMRLAMARIGARNNRRDHDEVRIVNFTDYEPEGEEEHERVRENDRQAADD